jgi:hypothetical protein
MHETLATTYLQFSFPCCSRSQDLKQPYHLLNKTNEELKRLAAVESLMEVSAKQNVSAMMKSVCDTFGFHLCRLSASCIS